MDIDGYYNKEDEKNGRQGLLVPEFECLHDDRSLLHALLNEE